MYQIQNQRLDGSIYDVQNNNVPMCYFQIVVKSWYSVVLRLTLIM